MSTTRKCEACGDEKPIQSFYRNHNECRNCVRSRVVAIPLASKVEAHRQEKLLRQELRKIAKARLNDRRQKAKAAAVVKKRAAAVKTYVIEEGEKLQTDAATRELARRELHRRKLIEFIKGSHPNYKAGWVHHDICSRLERFSREVTAGMSPRLMLLVPPRHGKSEIASKKFPAWHLGHNPTHEFIGCSYGITLALEFSREVRDLIKSKWYSQLFPETVLNPEVVAAESWKLLSPTGIGSGGGYNAAGVGGGITGKGAHILGIDDPIKNAEEADSVDIRNKNWDWYRSTAYTRLAPGGGVLIIQTCWHFDDLAGRIQQEMKDNWEDVDVDKFEIIRYPAEAEEDEEYRLKGEALHPERYTIEQLHKIKKTIGLRFWAALYQQSPIVEEGAYFTKEMVKYRDNIEDFSYCNFYIAWDFAISEEKQNDWTVGVVLAQDYDDNLHALEMRRFKTNSVLKIIDEVLDLSSKYQKAYVGFEDGQIWKTMRRALEKRMQERNIYISINDENILKPLRDKMVRARPLQARMQLGKVTFPRGAAWVDDFIREALRFPAGAHEDTIDAMAWAATLATGKTPPMRPRVQGRRAEKTVAEQLRALQRGAGGSHMAG